MRAHMGMRPCVDLHLEVEVLFNMRPHARASISMAAAMIALIVSTRALLLPNVHQVLILLHPSGSCPSTTGTSGTSCRTR